MKKIVFVLLVGIVLLSGCTQKAPDSDSDDSETKDVSAEIVQNGDTVKVDYRGWLDSGEQFDSSEGRAPLEFTLGEKQVIAGFEQAVLGHRVGEEVTIKIPPKDGYGETQAQYIIEIPKTQFQNMGELEVGQAVQSAQGTPGIVKEIKDDSIIIDFNHPLAGKTLNFSIKIVEIKKA